VVRPAAAQDGSARRFEEALQDIDVPGLGGVPIAAIVPEPTLPQETGVPVPGGDAAQAGEAGREQTQAVLPSGVLLISVMASGDAGTALVSVDPMPGEGAQGATIRTNVPSAAQAGAADAAAYAAVSASREASGPSLPYGAWESHEARTSGGVTVGVAALAEARATAELPSTSRAAGVPHTSVVPASLATTLAAAGAAGMPMDRGGEASPVVRTADVAGAVNFRVNSLESGVGSDRGLVAASSQVYGTAATLMPASFAATLAEGAKQSGASVSGGEQPLATLLGERLHYQIGRRTQHATLRLDPPSMGSIEILIRNEGGSLHVQLRASNAEVARQLQGIGDSLRQDLAQRQQGEVSVQIDDGTRDPEGRQRQRHGQTWQQAPGRGLNDMSDEPRAAAFSMNMEAR
jgi:flagellar hook-length control protein FliK